MEKTVAILPEIDKTGQGSDHFIVAIGASAGGLEAIHEFFDNLAGDTGLSFVVIQHLSPDYKSLLVELVGKHTDMNVYEAENDMVLERNCVYIIPNKKLIEIKDGKLKLVEKAAAKGPNTAIDSFLYTLAKEKGKHAIAIILSGTGTDGTKGIEKIKKAGGLVMVQDPATAKFDGMPNSAINSENVDYVLPAELMPPEIYEYVKIAPADPLLQLDLKEELLNNVFAFIHHCTGWDFNSYKRPTIFRRINKRMITGGFKSFEEYAEYLQKNPDECLQLSRDFLIGVSRFFRDKAAFEMLSSEVFPSILKAKQSGDIIKIWISACSTGEEAYSIAILLDSFLQQHNKILSVKIFATDINQKAIEVAAKGWYNSNIEKDIEPGLLERYFIKENSQYVVVPHIRKQIVFACHNLLKDPPFIKNDLISCRNMLIYMDAGLQKKVLNTLHFSLNDGGYLFLGSSESATEIKDKADEISSRWKIYRKRPTEKSVKEYKSLLSNGNYLGEKSKIVTGQQNKNTGSLIDDFKETLAEDFEFAGVYVDQAYEIKEAVGNFRQYLSLPDKLINLNILKMVPKEISALLITSSRQAVKDGKKVRLKNVKFLIDGEPRYLDLLIKPPVNNNNYFLIVFGESFEKKPAVEVVHEVQDATPANLQLLSELEAELKETRLNLQTAIEELETTNEELQSSNEELLSSNEELQSSNEELQSLNEELHTLNTEHQLKIRELIELNNDLNNYFRTTDIGQIFLDEKMQIRKFNDAAVKMINLIESDIGRPINHISTNIKEENLLSDLQAVMSTGKILEKEIVLHSDTNCLLRISPYLTEDKRRNGIVITFVDISALKSLDSIIKGVFNTNIAAIMAFKAERNRSKEITDFKWVAANKSAHILLNDQSPEGKKLKSHFPRFADAGFFDKLITVVESDKMLRAEFEMQKDDSIVHYEVTAVKMMDGAVVTLTDVTDKKEADNTLRRNYAELNLTKEKLRKLNAELESKIVERTRELSESEERFRLVSKATNDAIWDWNLSSDSVWYSETFAQILGEANDERKNNRLLWVSRIHSDDKDRVLESLNGVINGGGDNWSEEYRIMKKDGRYAAVLDRGFLIKDENGTPFRMVGSMLDVTELRNAEKEVVTSNDHRVFMAESIPLILWTASPAGKLNFLNKNFYITTGLDSTEEPATIWRKAVLEEDIPALQSSFVAALKSKEDFSLDIRVKYNNEYRWHLLRARAQKDADGRLVMWVGTLTDIDEQKRLTDILENKVRERTLELENAVKDLKFSNNSLEQFAYIASHDLKEPLRKINMYSTEIKRRFVDEANTSASEYMDKVISSCSRLTKLINDLLSFSTISANNDFQPTDLTSILEDVTADLELLISEKRAVVNFGSLPIVEAISSQIRQLFQNLIGNALKFNKKDTVPVIDITFKRISEKFIDAAEAEDGPYVRIEVKDNGIGFPQEYLEKIFMIFQRLHGRSEYEGTGIGLAITKSIVEKHNGTITARSRENEGATFIILLPLEQPKQR